MGNVASMYSLLGMHGDALVLKEKVLHIFRGALPEDHPDISDAIVVNHAMMIVKRFAGTAMCNLASTYSALGRLQDSLALQQEVLEFDRRTENHPHTGLTCYNMSSILAQIGDFPQALEFMHAALRAWQASFPPSHPRILLAQEQLAKIHEHLA